MSLQFYYGRILSLLWCLLILCCADAVLAKKKPPTHPINLNSASAAELQQVPGIGPSTAEKILQMRNSYGAFKSVDDLLAIKGIGPKRLEKMRKYLTVEKAAQDKKASTSAQAAPTAAKSPPAKKVAPKPPAKSNPPPEPSANDDEEP
jgi:competence ComEA-like helix-hairpin-helix protein